MQCNGRVALLLQPPHPAQVVGQADEDQDLRALSAPSSQGEEAEGPLS